MSNDKDKDIDFSEAEDIEIADDVTDDSMDSSWDEFDADSEKSGADKSSGDDFAPVTKKKSFLQKYFYLVVGGVAALGGGAYFLGTTLFPPASVPPADTAAAQQEEPARAPDTAQADTQTQAMPAGITELPPDSAPMPAPIGSDNVAADAPPPAAPPPDLIPLPTEGTAPAASEDIPSNTPSAADISETPSENAEPAPDITAGTQPAQSLKPVPVGPVAEAEPPAPVDGAANVGADSTAIPAAVPVIPDAAREDVVRENVVREYEQKIADAEKRFAEEKKSLETEVSDANQKISELEEKIADLNKKLEDKKSVEQSKIVPLDVPPASAPVSEAAPLKQDLKEDLKKETPPEPVLKTERSDDSGKSSARWELRSAQPGRAVLAPRGSNDLVTVGVGDVLPGIGRITAIDFIGGQWVVQGTQARLAR